MPEPRLKALIRLRIAVLNSRVPCKAGRMPPTEVSEGEFLELSKMVGQYIGFCRVPAMLQLEVASCPI